MYFKRPVYFTSKLLISILTAFINAKISMSLLKKVSDLGVILIGVFCLGKQWYLYVFNLLFFSWWLFFLKHYLIFLVTLLYKNVHIYSAVYLSCVCLGFFLQGLN